MTFNVFNSILYLLMYDFVMLAVLTLMVAVLAKAKQASFALVRRNFVGYFTNPTGYVFLCIFMFLTSLAAFWPYEFFNSNLATLEQLNRYFPLIMLFFIPAITMSIWAEERRQGTDELLLTLPADDFDIVIGKYLAASAIFTASLLFSQVANFTTMAFLTRGDVDVGLFFTTYLGYWFTGLTMIAIGMVASFLTPNLTVSFILGALFNAPLAFASMADAVVPNEALAKIAAAAGIKSQFDDFGRGVISSAAVAYFVLATMVGLYVCMVLIGRRHWTGGKDGNGMALHYVARIFALLLIATSAVVILRSKDLVRLDATEQKVSSLSDATVRLIQGLKTDQPIAVDVYISNNIPEQYAKTRYEVVSLLKEFKAEAARQGKTINLNLFNDIELFSEEAKQAEDRFGIEPQTRFIRAQGAVREERILFGGAFRSGLEKVVIPFFETGIPVEYELVRSISTVSREKRKKLGIVRTDAQLMGGFTMVGMSPQQLPKSPLVDELEKQYDVEEVTLDAPIAPGQFDVLLAVQPSSLSPEQLPRLIEAIRNGIPTAIYEDPLPGAMNAPGTGDPKQPPGGMFGGGGQVPKGDIKPLWELLELEIPGEPTFGGGFEPRVVWQRYNPYPKLARLSANDLWVFARDEAPGDNEKISTQNPITNGLKEILFLFSGSVNGKKDGKLTKTPLIQTGTVAGSAPHRDVKNSINQPGDLSAKLGKAEGPQTLGMVIEGEVESAAADAKAAEGEKKEGEKPAAKKANNIKVVYVADIDLMHPVFLRIRATPEEYAEFNFRFDNVTFLLNSVDWLAGELDYVEVRKHQQKLSTLRVLEEIQDEARESEEGTRFAAQKKLDEDMRTFEEKNDEELKRLQDRLQDMQKKSQDGSVSMAEIRGLTLQFQTKQEQLRRARDVKQVKLERERDLAINRVRRQADLLVQKKQNNIKLVAVALPCIPPLIVGLAVFFQRRLLERETISKTRLR